MKRDLRQLPRLLETVAALQVVCLVGEDGTAIREAARRVVEAVGGRPDDPFRVSECDGDSEDAVEAALATPTLSAGRSVVRVRAAGERLVGVAEGALAATTGPLLLLEYAGAGPRSRLRALIERGERGCVLACDRPVEAARQVIRSTLAASHVTADDETVALLCGLAAAPGASAEAVGLAAALIAGAGQALSADDVRALTGSAAAERLDSALVAALGGRGDRLDAVLAESLAEGLGGVAIIRMALMPLQRQRLAALGAGRGTFATPSAAHRPTGPAATTRWDAARLSEAALALWRAERLTKSNGVPQDTVTVGAVAGLTTGVRSHPTG